MLQSLTFQSFMACLYTHRISSLRTGAGFCKPAITRKTETREYFQMSEQKERSLGTGSGRDPFGPASEVDRYMRFYVFASVWRQNTFKISEGSCQQRRMPLDPWGKGPLVPLWLARQPQSSGLHRILVLASLGLGGDSEEMQKQSPRDASMRTNESERPRMIVLHRSACCLKEMHHCFPSH